MPFSLALKRLRQERHLSQSELAQAVDISKSAIAMYETGKREPNFETLEAFADYFNVNMDVLLDKDNSDTTQGVSLSQHESELINKYRRLSPDLQEDVDDYIDLKLNKQERFAEKDATNCA